MIGNQTMVHHVQPWHLYSCDGTCTSSGLCRRPLSMVAFHIFYLLDHSSIHEMLALMPRFHCIIRYLHPLWRSHSLYIVRGDDHMWHMSIIPIHGHWTLNYSGLLHYIFAVTCWDLSLYCAYEWLCGKITGRNRLLLVERFRPWCWNKWRNKK